jgi:hypothetical protein
MQIIAAAVAVLRGLLNRRAHCRDDRLVRREQPGEHRRYLLDAIGRALARGHLGHVPHLGDRHPLSQSDLALLFMGRPVAWPPLVHRTPSYGQRRSAVQERVEVRYALQRFDAWQP